jgi:hypothetical protein
MVVGGAMIDAIFKAEQTADGFHPAISFFPPGLFGRPCGKPRLRSQVTSLASHQRAAPPKDGPSRGRLRPSWTLDLLEEEDLRVRQEDKADLV